MRSLHLSVVIPTHNRPRLLQHAVSSVQAQTERPYELVIIDDGSEPPIDPTAFVDSPIPIRVIRNNKALGAAAARNVGVENAQGDFIAFLDDDDTWLPEKLATVKSCLATHRDVDVVIHQTGYQASAQVGGRTCVALDNPLERMLHQQPPSLDSVVVQRVLHLRSPLDQSFVGAEDLDYLIRLAKVGARMVEIDLVLAILGHSETTAIGIDHRIQGRLELLARHPEIRTDATARAFFYLRLGHQYRRNGERSKALRSFGQSLSAQISASAAKGMLLSILPKNLQERLIR